MKEEPRWRDLTRSNVRFVFMLRHSATNITPGSDGLSAEGLITARRMTQEVIKRLPVKIIEQSPRSILLITTSKTRSIQSVYALMNELGLNPIMNDFLRPDMRSRDIKERVLEEVSPDTQAVIIMCHNPQVDFLPRLLAPHLLNPRKVFKSRKPGEGYFADIREGTWKEISGHIQIQEGKAD